MHLKNHQNTALEKNTVYVFIDASNLWETQKAKGRFFDYEKFRNYIKQKFEAVSKIKAALNEEDCPRMYNPNGSMNRTERHYQYSK